MGYFIIIIIGAISIIVPLIFKMKFDKDITYFEWLTCICVSIFISFVVYELGSYNSFQDTEVLNTEVFSKKIIRKNCEYPGWYKSPDWFCTNVNTRSVVDHYETKYCTNSKGKSYSCGSSPVYRTEYSYDYPWEQKFYIYSPFKTFKVSRVDRQGAITPPRYLIVNVGDPVSITHSYQNYLLQADQSILSPKNISISKDELSKIPDYPSTIYDMYKINRLITIGMHVDNEKHWNEAISNVAKTVGPIKQANPIVIITNEPPDIRYAIEKKWLGGKKNDVIVLIGVNKDKTIKWSDVITFMGNTGNEVFTRELKNSINDLKVLDCDKLMVIIKNTVLHKFDRKAMKSIEYLKDSFNPPMWVSITSIICSLIVSIVASILAMKYDFFNQNFRRKLICRNSQRFF
jgi:hypothetical protein